MVSRGDTERRERARLILSVQSSIAEVAQGFVSPASYSIDVDRLLLGRESSLRTHSVGVLQIMIHGAEDLPKTDTMGSCDPYVAISFSKFNKPSKPIDSYISTCKDLS